jgi:glycerol uptake facilitator-like aquaporin
MRFNLRARLTAEFLGTAFLVAAVIGSGIMGERLAGGNVAIALLANTVATGAALVALILTFGPISGAHLNPAVTLADALERGIPWPEAVAYMLVQCAGGIDVTGKLCTRWNERESTWRKSGSCQSRGTNQSKS